MPNSDAPNALQLPKAKLQFLGGRKPGLPRSLTTHKASTQHKKRGEEGWGYLGEMWVGVEAALVADLAVTLGAGVVVGLAGGRGELRRLADGAEGAAGQGGDLGQRVGRGGGAAPLGRRGGRAPRSLAPRIHLEHPPLSLRLPAAAHLPGALRAGCQRGEGRPLSRRLVQLLRSPRRAEMPGKHTAVSQG